MLKAEELRNLSDKQKEKDGEVFAIEMLPEVEKEMRLRAEQGHYEFNLSGNNSLNKDGWLSKPHLYNPVIKELEKYDYKVSHCDDVRDGTYMIIRW